MNTSLLPANHPENVVGIIEDDGDDDDDVVFPAFLTETPTWGMPLPCDGNVFSDVLYFLVGSDEEGRSIPPARVVRFMEESGLMRPVRGGGALRITDKG